MQITLIKEKSVLIVRDAETNYSDAISEIKKALNGNNFVVPNGVCEKATNDKGISIGFLLFPTCSKELLNGTLEDLWLNIIIEENKEEVKNIVDGYLNNMKIQGYTKLKHYHKNILHSYLQAKDKFVTL